MRPASDFIYIQLSNSRYNKIKEYGNSNKNILKIIPRCDKMIQVISRNNCRRFEKSGSIKDSINGNIYIDQHCIDSHRIDAGRQISRTWGYQRRRRHILGQEQGAFHGRKACDDNQAFGNFVPGNCRCIEYWKLLTGKNPGRLSVTAVFLCLIRKLR